MLITYPLIQIENDGSSYMSNAQKVVPKMLQSCQISSYNSSINHNSIEILGLEDSRIMVNSVILKTV